MTATEYLLLSGPACGIMMVLGGILLLYKGAISLTEASKEGALSIEFKKEMRISTQYPALGFFVIGLLFVLVPLFIGEKPEREVVIKASATNLDRPLKFRVIGGEWGSNSGFTDEISRTISLNLEELTVEFWADGYKLKRSQIPVTGTRVVKDFGTITLTQNNDESELSAPKVAELPSGTQLAGVNEAPAFGRTQ